MIKRKKFTISEDIDRGITEVINAVTNNVGSFRYEIVALSKIEIDPSNPREMALTSKDLMLGITTEDTQSAQKNKEKEELESLAHTIKQSGIINPVMVYKHNDMYRLVAGERRFLAAHLAGKNDIHARIVDKKPDEMELRLLQWVENNERKGLSLNERIKNLEAIIDAYSKQQNAEPITADLLKKITGLSKTQAHCYLVVIKGHSDLRKNIEKDIINSLDKAVLIAGISDQALRETAMLACVNGITIQNLKEIVEENKKATKKELKKTTIKQSGRIAKFVNLGRTKNTKAIKKIVDTMLSQAVYNKYFDSFKNINWDEYKSVSIAFQNLLDILNKECK